MLIIMQADAALSDGPRSLRADRFSALMQSLAQATSAAGRQLTAPRD